MKSVKIARIISDIIVFIHKLNLMMEKSNEVLEGWLLWMILCLNLEPHL